MPFSEDVLCTVGMRVSDDVRFTVDMRLADGKHLHLPVGRASPGKGKVNKNGIHW